VPVLPFKNEALRERIRRSPDFVRGTVAVGPDRLVLQLAVVRDLHSRFHIVMGTLQPNHEAFVVRAWTSFNPNLEDLVPTEVRVSKWRVFRDQSASLARMVHRYRCLIRRLATCQHHERETDYRD
jgi:hypothetical protein